MQHAVDTVPDLAFALTPDIRDLIPRPRPKVLVVGGEIDQLGPLTHALDGDYELQTETSPFLALVALEDDGPFAAVVAHETLPGLHGTEILDRARCEYPDTPRILLIGSEADADPTADVPSTGPAAATVIAHETLSGGHLGDASIATRIRHIVDDATGSTVAARSEHRVGLDALHDSIETLMRTLALDDPAAFSITKRVTELVDAHLGSHSVQGAWDISLAARLCEIGCEALAQVLTERLTGPSPDIAVESVTATSVFSDELLTVLPQLQTVEHLLRYHRDPTTTNEFVEVPYGARLLFVIMTLVHDERTCGSRQEVAELLLADTTADRSIVLDVLDDYLVIGRPSSSGLELRTPEAD